MQLLDCPAEIVIVIFSNLNLKDLLSIAQTCSTAQLIVKESLVLQYIIELYASGHTQEVVTGLITEQEGSSLPTQTTDQSLQLLQCYQDCWKRLDRYHFNRIRLPEGCPIYEIYGNVFIQLWHHDETDPRTGEPRQGYAMHGYRLPSGLRGLPDTVEKWTHPTLRVNKLLEVDLDPDQDLLVLIDDTPAILSPDCTEKVSIYFRTLSENLDHPGAKLPVVGFTPQVWGDDNSRVVTQIVGDLLAVLYNPLQGPSDSDFVLWRWTTGQLLLRFSSPGPALSCTFLSENTFLLPIVHHQPTTLHFGLYVYRIPRYAVNHNPPSATIADKLTPVVKDGEFTPSIVFKIPLIDGERVHDWGVVCRSHPRPSPRSYKPCRPNHLAQEPLPAGDPNNEEATATSSTAPSCPITVLQAPLFTADTIDRLVTVSFIHSFTRPPDDIGLSPMAGWGLLRQASYVFMTHVSTLLAPFERLPEEEALETPLPSSSDAFGLDEGFGLESMTLGSSDEGGLPAEELGVASVPLVIGCGEPFTVTDEVVDVEQVFVAPPEDPGSSTSLTPRIPSSTLVIPWEEWSPGKVRIVQDMPRRNWYSHTFGYRFVQPHVRRGDEHGFYQMRVLDLNQYTVRREVARLALLKERREQDRAMRETRGHVEQTDDITAERTEAYLGTNHRSQVVTEPTTIPAYIFKEPVSTSLPYIQTTFQHKSRGRSRFRGFIGLMIDDEHLFNLETDNFGLGVFTLQSDGEHKAASE